MLDDKNRQISSFKSIDLKGSVHSGDFYMNYLKQDDKPMVMERKSDESIFRFSKHSDGSNGAAIEDRYFSNLQNKNPLQRGSNEFNPRILLHHSMKSGSSNDNQS